MRKGVNPEKKKLKKLEYKQHRIIIPVYVPMSDENYFSNLFEVFKTSINSLLQTVDIKKTAITILNNNCKSEVTSYINQLLKEELIDKNVIYSRNCGKVYAILSEARASYENFITIADADVFYFNGWEKEVFKIFSAFNKVGVVSPLPAPQVALYNNVSLFGAFFKRIKKGNIVDPESFSFFEKGINNPKIFQSSKFNLKEKQYYLERNEIKACVGSGHFIATYRNEFKRIPVTKPEYVFKEADENAHLDTPFDKLGYFRLSTISAYAYHLGNTIPSWCLEYKFDRIDFDIKNLEKTSKIKRWTLRYNIKYLYFKILKKINFI